MEKELQYRDEIFMRRAIDLAFRGAGDVSPNPMVGCVIVHDDVIIGEGWHRKYGGPHAEVNAIDSVVDKSLLPQSTVYVTLEPCSHFGKTPPCADMLIRENVGRVVIANVDTNPLVGGRGIKKLVSAGKPVAVAVLEEEGRELNKRFFTFVEKQRPYVILKWAQTANGFIAKTNFDSKWISNELSRKLVHRWRSEEDAVLVGTNTAKYDNPKLNVRGWSGRNPVRVLIDKNLALPHDINLFDNTQKTICYNIKKNDVNENTAWVKLSESRFIPELMSDLYEKKIQSIIIEGGSQTLQSFIALGLWDEARIFQSSIKFGAGIAAPKLTGKLVGTQTLTTDTLSVFLPA